MRLGLWLDPDDALNPSLWLVSKLPGRRSAFEARRKTSAWCPARPDPRLRSEVSFRVRWHLFRGSEFVGTSSAGTSSAGWGGAGDHPWKDAWRAGQGRLQVLTDLLHGLRIGLAVCGNLKVPPPSEAREDLGPCGTGSRVKLGLANHLRSRNPSNRRRIVGGGPKSRSSPTNPPVVPRVTFCRMAAVPQLPLLHCGGLRTAKNARVAQTASRAGALTAYEFSVVRCNERLGGRSRGVIGASGVAVELPYLIAPRCGVDEVDQVGAEDARGDEVYLEEQNKQSNRKG